VTDQTQHDMEAAVARIVAFLDARDAALAHVPRIGPGIVAGWPRTDNDADGEFELTATDLRAVLAALSATQKQAANNQFEMWHHAELDVPFVTCLGCHAEKPLWFHQRPAGVETHVAHLAHEIANHECGRTDTGWEPEDA